MIFEEVGRLFDRPVSGFAHTPQIRHLEPLAQPVYKMATVRLGSAISLSHPTCLLKNTTISRLTVSG